MPLYPSLPTFFDDRQALERRAGLLLDDERATRPRRCGPRARRSPARSPLVTQALVPLTIHSSPSRDRPARDVAGVGARVGLRQRQRAAWRAGRQLGSQRSFCSAVPKVSMSVAHIVWVLTTPESDIHPYDELLDHADVGEQVEPEAAVLLGHGDAEEPELLHLLDDRGGVLVGVLELGGDRDHLVRDPPADGRDHLLAQLGVGRGLGGHRRPSWSGWRRRRCRARRTAGCSRPSGCPGTCRSPASPRSWRTISCI